LAQATIAVEAHPQVWIPARNAADQQHARHRDVVIPHADPRSFPPGKAVIGCLDTDITLRRDVRQSSSLPVDLPTDGYHQIRWQCTADAQAPGRRV
jgi:hypothetical protein